MLLEIFIIAVILWLIRRRWNIRKFLKLEKHIKSKLSKVPILGHAHHFIGNHELHMQLYAKLAVDAMDNGGYSSLWLGNEFYVVVAEPVAAETLLKVYLEKGDVMKVCRFLTGNGSVFAQVPIWRPRRKILVPTFKPQNLYSFGKIFAKQANVMNSCLKAKAGKGPFPFWPFISNYTMDAVCESALGINMNVQKQPENAFLKAFENACYLIAKRIVEPWSFSDVLYKLNPDCKKLSGYRDTIYSFIYGILKSKHEEVKKKLELRNNEDEDKNCIKTFIDLMMEGSAGSGGFSDLELMEETLVIVLAGTDTSAVAAAFTCLLLSQYQDVQDKVYEELKEVFGDSKRPTVPEDLASLKYLDVVIRESLRLYPPVPITVRKAHKDYTVLSGLKIPEGCTIFLHIWGIHRNPKFWGPDAEQFRPERFFEPLKHPAQFMPFSYGSRNCLGYNYAMMSLKTNLSMLLRRYRLLPATPQTNGTRGHRPPRLRFDIMMKDVDNFMLQLEERY